MAPIIFVLGGARSGKSRFAEQRTRAFAAKENIYVATAECRDDEMEKRIALHRERRGSDWRTIEAPHQLSEALSLEARNDRAILVDCLTLWLTNRLLADADLQAESDGLAAALQAVSGPVVLVSNEVGLSIVPENALARRFRDEAGRLNQAIAAIADEAWFVAAGLPLRLK
ncbi:bifunctional adenosylcobinamide kinase/adenosylcobinamide-phosphate guanylyltransferase [Pleomorphomonas sp. JP5]|uniref:bifunctional adenosylcobinamide kinase/adenosylcobinamide-phosphate guanylyltransferase n=1 Tax=Pleomorphomonas sp. JP5 TaxID=2942998 RepID=UPI002043D3E3|nr:bifunctional adenosylcobinamide kinase/adenosylcobinamide-phosphate guanylyltransferase [Pleomorphomonas sp. JP5]MCM5556464.1 bifunctional adenosylcobinamide kinase/adenosylcobinamide-phosphate guanylyltransferase [Pleomorphomonas sp. JP5]